MTTLTDTLIIPMPRRIADNEVRRTTLSSTLGSLLDLIAEAMEGASAARCRYPSAD